MSSATFTRITHAPWGVSRMTSYPTVKKIDYTITEIDPMTQIGIARDADGNIQPITAENTRQRTRDATGRDGTYDDDHLDDRR